MMQQEDKTSRVSVGLWDIPTRLTHLLFVCLIGALWWTNEIDEMEWHAWSGYALLTILIFRLYWGFLGSSSARFSSFVVGPRAVQAYARDLFRRSGKKQIIGHNPIGGWAVIALLALMFFQVGLGLFAVDVDGIESGPLSYYVTFDFGRTLAELHEEVFDILLAFIIIHVVGVLFYLVFKKMNLIAPMVTGRMQIPVEDSRLANLPTFAPLWRALVGLGLSATITWLIISL